MENGDYLSVKKVDNRYVFELNAYSCDKVKQRKCVVAHSSKIEKEIAKCDILCANCHRKLHWEEKHRAVA
jgi:predicted GH43/DUF377 family glycosyl hydrolase